MWKTILREIKQSFGRFFAILAIIALGVGFFAGLKVTRTAMVETVQKYWEDSNFYDFRLLSTQGFDQKDLSDPLYIIEGAISFDIICQGNDNNEFVMKAHSLTNQVNQIKLTAGRMPETSSECIVDSKFYQASQIGEKLIISENNTAEDKEHFVFSEYTVVGIVQSPNYIQFERGNSALGNGRISGFFYLEKDGFADDYFTEFYVKCPENFPLYSQEYKDYIKEEETNWEKRAEKMALSRYNDLLADAREEIEEGEQELQEEKEKAQAELKEAEDKLLDAKEEIEKGEKEIKDARKELEDGQTVLTQKEKELLDAEALLAEEEKKLQEGKAELEKGKAKWEDGNSQAEDAEKEFLAKQGELQKQQEALEASASQLEAGKSQLALEEAKLLEQERLFEIRSQALKEQEEQLNIQEAMLLEQYGTIPEPYASQIAQGREEIQTYQAQLEEGKVQLEEGKRQIEQKKQELEEGQKQIEEGRVQLAGYQAQLEAGRGQIEQANRELASSWMEIEKNEKELEEGQKRLEEAKQELIKGRKQLEEAKKEWNDGEAKLREAEQELEEGKAEYEDGKREYEKGLREFEQETADAEQEIADAKQELADVEKPETYVLGRDTNVGYVCFENDSAIVDGIANIFPIFFFLVAALVCITTMNRMVEEQRTQIGVLKALGYGKGAIMAKYLIYSGFAALLGCFIGFFGGTYLFPQIIWNAYGMMYQAQPLLYIFDWKLAIISLSVAMICSLGTTWLSCRYELLEVAAELMRPKAPKAGKRVLLERIPIIWNHLKFLYKVSYRNIFRYKKRFFMMVIGISGCCALLVAAFGVKDSIADVGEQQFGEIQIYDISVTLTDSLTEEMQQKISQVAGEEILQQFVVMEQSADLVTNKGSKGINVVVMDNSQDITPFLNLHTTKKTPIAFPKEGEAIITHRIASNYELEIGSEITLRDDEMKSITASISNINENFIYNYVYLNADTYRSRMGEEPEWKTLWINLKEEADAHLVMAKLMELEGIASVTVNKDNLERFSSMMKSLDLVVIAVIICAAGLAFIVLYNLTNINITERIREIATIKVLGFYKKETASYVFRENMALTAIGIGVGLLLGYYLHQFIMNEIQVDMIAFDIRILPLSYVYSIFFTFFFAWVVNGIMGRKLEKISMTESLKSVD